MIKIKKLAVALAAGGTVLSLIGVGVGVNAAFTDRGTATQAFKVGTFGCALSSTTPTATVTPDGHSVTYLPPDVMSSAASSSPFTFIVTSTGTIPTNVAVTQSTPVAPFTSLLANSTTTLSPALGLSVTYAAGLSWPELVKADLGKTVRITYTATCTEAPAVPTPLDPMYITDRTTTSAAFPNGHPAQVNYVVQYYKVFQCNYTAGVATVSAPTPATNGAPGTWTNGSSHYYILAFNDGQASPPPASACPAYV